MKTNSFNEAIRRKLEQIQPDVGPDAWERFQAHRQPVARPLWKTVWAKAAMVFIALGAVAGGVHLAHIRQAAALQQTVRQLTRQRDSLLSAQASIPPGPVAPQPVAPQPGTGQGQESIPAREEAVRSSERERPEATSPTSHVDLPAGVPARSPRLAERKSENPASLGAARWSKHRAAAEVPRPQPDPAGTLGRPLARQTGTQGTRQERAKGDFSEKLANRRASLPAGGTPTDVFGPDPAGRVERRSERLVLPDVARLTPRPVIFDSLPPSAPTIPYYAFPERTERAARTAPPLPWAGRLAVTGRFAAGHRAGRVTGEIPIGPRLGLQVGLQSERVTGPRYTTEQEYERYHRRDFRRQYVPNLPPRINILNITETYSLVSLPLRITYTQPLVANWWGVLAAGTDLDLSVRHRVQYDIYDFRPRPSESGRREYRAAVPVAVLTNWVLSAGVEKRLGRVGLQLSSSWVVPLRAPVYRQSVAVWGAQVGLSYQLGNAIRRRTQPLSPPS